MLEKLNCFRLLDGRIRKLCPDVTGGKAELAVLRYFASPSGSATRFKVPKLHADASTPYAIEMEYLPGITVYDLITLLDQHVSEQQDPKLAAIRSQLLQDAIDDVGRIHSRDVQQALLSVLGPLVTPYDYCGKWSEAIDYLHSVTGLTPQPQLREAIVWVCSALARRSSVTFRDASLRNRLVVNPIFYRQPSDDGYESSGREATTSFHLRLSDHTYNDLSKVANWFAITQPGDELRASTVNVDFESICFLTSPEDDFAHILFSERSGYSYREAAERCKRLASCTDEDIDRAVLFRSVRETARKVFYLRERPSLYRPRYAHDRPEYLLDLAVEAIERLTTVPNYRGVLAPLQDMIDVLRHSLNVWLIALAA